MATVTSLWRHPIKSHGRDAPETTTLIAGHTMPGDRVCAPAHDGANAGDGQWVGHAVVNYIGKISIDTEVNVL